MNGKETDWLSAISGFGFQRMEEAGFGGLLLVMGVSLACSLFVALLYLVFYRERALGSEVHRAFPLLGLSITGIFVSIQFSLPLSLGLLGALSIVRFRTPIKEPEEIGFIMLVVATSLCCATFNMLFLAIILVTAVAALVVMSGGRGLLARRGGDGMLIVTLPARDYAAGAEQLLSLLRDRVPNGRLDSITETGEESTVSYSFRRLDGRALVGVQQALRDLAAGATANVFFHQAREL